MENIRSSVAVAQIFFILIWGLILLTGKLGLAQTGLVYFDHLGWVLPIGWAMIASAGLIKEAIVAHAEVVAAVLKAQDNQ